jgi:uncharacterized protein (DUF1778 family)
MDNSIEHSPRYRIEIKMSQAEKAALVAAAERRRVGLSEFVRNAALEAAKRT